MSKYLVFDVDGTLLQHGNPKVCDSAVEAINKAKQLGYKIVIATGRGFKFLQHDIKESLVPDYYVMVNGGCINDKDGKTIDMWPMTLQQTEKILKLCMEHDYPCGFKFDDSLQAYYKGEEFLSRYSSKAILREDLDDNSDLMNYHLTHALPLDCFMFSNDGEAMKLAEEFDDLTFYRASAVGVECYPKVNNKAKAIKALVEKYGDSLDDCYCFGDSENDIEMLNECKVAIVMGNGTQPAKDVADYITDRIENDGLAKAIYKVINGEL